MLSFGVQFCVAVVYFEKKLKFELVRTEFLIFSFSARALNSWDLMASRFSMASVLITELFAIAWAILNIFFQGKIIRPYNYSRSLELDDFFPFYVNCSYCCYPIILWLLIDDFDIFDLECILKILITSRSLLPVWHLSIPRFSLYMQRVINHPILIVTG